jgi:hypothetical protein
VLGDAGDSVADCIDLPNSLHPAAEAVHSSSVRSIVGILNSDGRHCRKSHTACGPWPQTGILHGGAALLHASSVLRDYRT